MPTTFLAGIGSKLAERWMAIVLTPAFAFWAGGVVAWAWGHDDGWRRLGDEITSLSGVEQVALAIGALILVATSGVAMQLLALPITRLLEGYWPWPLRSLARTLAGRREPRIERREERLQELQQRFDGGERTAADQAEFVRVDAWLRRVPTGDPGRLMATRLGNTLRSAEVWPLLKYGLDGVKWWPRLWLVLPEQARKELSSARSSLDLAAGVWGWGLLTLAWTVWLWWAPLVAVAVMVCAYAAMLRAARIYGDLLEASFDLYRWNLYEALRWPPPTTPADEQDTGRALTEYVWRGSDDPTPTFVIPPPPP